jgi:NADH dehydrogenase/NADH:ubiquinone oxidoreductase subunit G
MATLTINGRQVQAEEGQTILEAANANNIFIPTLCHHEALEPYGACRLCMVEVRQGGRSRIVASCLYPANDGLNVNTDTPRVVNVRNMVMELLMSRCPDSKEIHKLAARLGVESSRFTPEDDNHDCILCALCTRACREVVGASAISLVNRGVTRQMATPFYDFSEVCIACGSCAEICPTGSITITDKGDTRTVAMPYVTMEFKLKQCTVCGRYWAPERQLEFMRQQAGLPEEFYDKCPDCRD